jgi:hypothetical protein
MAERDVHEECGVVQGDMEAGSRGEWVFRSTPSAGSMSGAEADHQFFPKHYPGQRPEILWIGCKSSSQLVLIFRLPPVPLPDHRSPPRSAIGSFLVFHQAYIFILVRSTACWTAWAGADSDRLGRPSPRDHPSGLSTRRYLCSPQRRQVSSTILPHQTL